MTPFQRYAHARWTNEFPEWSNFREDIDGVGDSFDPMGDQLLHVRYLLPSPANPRNLLCVVFTPWDITTMFAVRGSHEHYDPDLYGGPDFQGDRSEFWPDAYDDAIAEYIRPVIEDRMFAVYYGEEAALVADVAEFMVLNRIEQCQYESWSRPSQSYAVESKRK